MKAFFEIDGKRYFGFEFYARSDSGMTKDYDIIVSESVRNRLRTLEGLTDEDYVLDEGTQIHVVPDCPVCMDDIRKNYTIRRSLDGGDCNVFSPYRKSVKWCLSSSALAVIPSLKAIVCDTQFGADRNSLHELINSFLPEASGLGQQDFVYHAERIYYMGIKISDAYIRLLEGTLSKPAISYRKLHLSHGNLLTPDALFMVYQAGMRRRTEANAEKNFVLELSALNQSDWRDYPGTVSLLMNEILKRSDCIKETVCRTRSRQPKAIKELLSVKPADFASDKDRKMASLLVQEILDIREETFTDIESLFGLMASKGISFPTLKSFFRNMVRIKPVEI